MDKETEKFTNIAQLVQGNTKDITELAGQVDVLNGMVEELEGILAEKYKNESFWKNMKENA